MRVLTFILTVVCLLWTPASAGCPPITLSPPSLPGGTLATAYSQTISATGGLAPYTYAVSAGALPPGLSLASNGVLSGTPTALGNYAFTVTALDSSGADGTLGCTGSQPYSIVIGCSTLAISPSSLPGATLGVAYNQTLVASGGNPPYTFAVTAGALPPGLSLNAGSGALTGTPTATGSFSFTVTTTDARGCTGSQAYTVAVTCPTISLSPSSLPNPTVNVPYNQTITASGGAAPYTFAVAAGSLPSGLSLNGATGAISGLPTTSGPSSFTISATDANGCVGTKNYSVTVSTCTLPPAWTQAASLAAARQGHTATLLPAGKVLVAGGNGSSNPASALSSCVLYDPAAGTWSPTGPLTTARGGQKAVLLIGGKVLVAGGTDVSGFAVAGAEIYNPASGTWSATGAMATPRYNHTLTLLPGGKALVAGGTAGSAALASAEVFNPSSGTWSAAPPMVGARLNHTATLLPNGKVLVAGGSGSSGAVPTAQLYDPSSGTWSPTGSMVSARSGHTATLLSNGKVLVAGGLGTSGLVASAEIYDPSLGTWSSTGAMIAPRFFHSETLLFSGKVLVAGGSGGSGFLSSAELYDPSAGTWGPAGSMATTREFHTATRLPNGKVLVAGGWKGSLGLTGAELFDPAPCYPNPIIVFPVSLPISIFATSYSQTIRAFSGGGAGGPFSFEIWDGALPPGLALDADTGTLEGVPTLEGTFDFTVVARALDGTESAGSQAYSLSVVSPIPITAFSSATDTSVSMSWTGVDGATGYSVWRAQGPSCSDAVKITDIPLEGTAYEDQGLQCGGTYTYFATAEGVCCLPPGGECGTVTLQTCSIPVEAAPLNWIDKDTLAWPSVAGAWSYNLYRGTRSSLPALLDGTANSCTVYEGAAALSWGAGDPSLLQEGDFYWYLVTAVNTAGEGSAGDASAGFRTVNSSGACP
ncbi:MAG TPA: putative Ig domain-containing protein [Candidatus Polarisedimenticolaceae bacterium]|nr:putative Ig domain-containing protein [Candidatus Polarisedimenticolaceae bacterium]